MRGKNKTINYQFAPDLQLLAEEISRYLFPHIKINCFRCFRSTGSSAKRTIARCHGLAKIMQKTLQCSPHYAIEFISEKFDRLPYQDKVKTIIHELMHIPKNFGGGFKYHNYVTASNVNRMYKKYQKLRQKNEQS
jgi:predicted metallopeptidase